jgi:hypothetical protein
MNHDIQLVCDQGKNEDFSNESKQVHQNVGFSNIFYVIVNWNVPF